MQQGGSPSPCRLITAAASSLSSPTRPSTCSPVSSGGPARPTDACSRSQAPRGLELETQAGDGDVEGRASDGFEGVREVTRGTRTADDAWYDVTYEPALSYATPSEDEPGSDQGDDDVEPRFELLAPPPQRAPNHLPPNVDSNYLASVIDARMYHTRLESGSTTGETRWRDSDLSSFATDDVASRATARTSSRLTQLSGSVLFSGTDADGYPDDSEEQEATGVEPREEDSVGVADQRDRHRDLAAQALTSGRQHQPSVPLDSRCCAIPLNELNTTSSRSGDASPPHPSGPRTVAPVESSSDAMPPSITPRESPSVSRDPFVSVASGHLAQLSARHLEEPRAASRGARSFFSNLLNRSPRSKDSSPRFPSSPSFADTSPNGTSPSTTPSRSPALDGIRNSGSRHNRTTSLPPSPVLPGSRNLSDDTPIASFRPTEDSPRISRTFVGIGRSVSLRTSPPRVTSAPDRSTASGSPPTPRVSTGPSLVPLKLPGSSARDSPLEKLGLSLVSITPQLRLSNQPLCGCILDDKYLLIGTSTGLDFLPLPLPGSLPIHQLGKKKRKETRKPISLIKRTRFRQLIVLSERSNVLLAIAGRSDQVRVYALEGIRLAIEKKMAEIDIRDGFPYIQDSAVLRTATETDSPQFTPSRTDPIPPPPGHPPPVEPISPPPTYTSIEPSSSTRRRPPPLQLTSDSGTPRPASPSSLVFSRRGSVANGAIVREVPTVPRSATSSQGPTLDPTPRSLRRQASREFSANRRSSTTATVPRRKSRVELNEGRKGKARSRNDSGQSSLYEPASTSTSRHLTTSADGPAANVEGPLKDGVKLQPRSVGRTDMSDLAQFLRSSGPCESTEEEWECVGTPNPVTASTRRTSSVGRPGLDRRTSSASTSRSPPPSPGSTGVRGSTPVVGSSSNNGLGVTSSAGSRTSTPRNAKRWTISGMSSLLNTGGLVAPSASPRPRSSTEFASSVTTPRSRRTSSTSDLLPRAGASGPRNSSRSAEVPTETKRRLVEHRPSLAESESPSIPSSSQERSEYPPSGASPFEYVKLARTRGSRLLRAVETKRRTYLAVLCGDDGDRIELFTGSRNISLSLNRTFVLPETPRSIDLQLQGDDLVDIYLIYAQSIFALEPSTVRVREVGVGRGDRRRRANGNRTRTHGDQTPATTPPVEENAPSTPGVESLLFRSAADQHDAGRNVTSSSGVDALTISAPTDQTSPSTSRRTTRERHSDISANSQPLNSSNGTTVTASGPARLRTSSKKVPPGSPYSTFNQLPFVPPLPSGLLSSSWIIPPTYSDVVARSPSPGLDLNPSLAGPSEARRPSETTGLPLLSPVSLLGGAALRNNGRPGLFFVSRGSSLTGIVTADGKSILKKPMSWCDSSSSDSTSDDSPQQVEILVSRGRSTTVVKLSTSNVKAIGFEEGSTATSVANAVDLTLTVPGSIQFLATHHTSQQLFFVQTCGSASWTVQCLAARTAT